MHWFSPSSDSKATAVPEVHAIGGLCVWRIFGIKGEKETGGDGISVSSGAPLGAEGKRGVTVWDVGQAP